MLLALIACAAEGGAPQPDTLPLRDLAAERGLDWPLTGVKLVVDKSDRRMWLYSGETEVKVYRVALGGAPEGDKVRQGDQRTPVGAFRVVTRNDRSLYHLFLGLSYPDAADADRGLRDGLITETQARDLREADDSRGKPRWDTALGGAIGVHGNGGAYDWTLGCIAVEDAEIEEIWEVAPHGTVVEIRE